MRQQILFIVAGVFFLTLLTACAPTIAPSTATTMATQIKPTATATAVSPTQTAPPTVTPSLAPTVTPSPAPTVTPVPEISFGPWKMLRQMKAKGPVYLAGFLNADFGITVGHSGDVRYTSDGGGVWTRAENKSACRFGLDIVDENTAWHCGNGGHVRVSTDGGRTWQVVTKFGPDHPDHCRFLSFLDAETGWAATPHQLGMTTDGGETWTEIPLPEGIQNIAAISLLDPADGYLLDSTGTLFITQDEGQTWSSYSLAPGGNNELVTSSTPTAALRFLDADHGVAIFQDRQHIWYAFTADGGQTWQQEEIPIPILRPSFYLAQDGKTLTMFDGSEIIVLSYN